LLPPGRGIERWEKQVSSPTSPLGPSPDCFEV
jgi:hypothetical protein